LSRPYFAQIAAQFHEVNIAVVVDPSLRHSLQTSLALKKLAVDYI
jgi:hypothetical protein